MGSSSDMAAALQIAAIVREATADLAACGDVRVPSGDADELSACIRSVAERADRAVERLRVAANMIDALVRDDPDDD